MRVLCALGVFAMAAASGAAACPTPGYAPELMATWADTVATAQRGPVDIADPGLGLASHGAPTDALGPATGVSTDVYSLGDGGALTLEVTAGIWNGPGDDFAVYENGFFNLDGFFAEFAFVEVSSDGVHFARFDSSSTHMLPVPAFGSIDPCDYQGLAGDKPLGEGTGFDLSELAGHPLVAAGQLDLLAVSHVRVVDIIGDGSTQDSSGMPLYDPYATPFDVGGFDVEAVGVLHAPEATPFSGLIAGCALLGLLFRRCTRVERPCSVPR